MSFDNTAVGTSEGTSVGTFETSGGSEEDSQRGMKTSPDGSKAPLSTIVVQVSTTTVVSTNRRQPVWKQLAQGK